MITLKKAFETQNVYKSLHSDVAFFLEQRNNIMTLTETHLKSKANSNDEDEFILTPKETEILVMDAVDFMQFLTNEIGLLTEAINNAKAASSYDSMIAANSAKRTFLNVITNMARLKPSETKTQAKAYTFNAEGNQTAYYYDKVTKFTIDYDRNAIKAIESRIRKECSDTSDKLDELLLTIKVDYTPLFVSGDTLEDAIASYVEKRENAS